LFNKRQESEQERAQRKGMALARAHREALAIEEGLSKETANNKEKKKGGIWRIITNSDNLGETLRKIGKEPVRLGPFSATVKGLASALAFLGPVVGAISGSLVAMTASVGGAAAAMGGVGLAAIGGYGQALLGIGMIIKPMADEFHAVSLTTNAYATAVQKYGENSKQANKAQSAMNNTLKSVSPTARAAYKDLAQVQTVFARMTAGARPALDSLLRSAMNAFRQFAPGFAKNSVDATKIASKSLGNVFDRINSARMHGRDPLNTMFVNANKSLGPLISGLGYLGEALAQIGASASKFLEPMTRAFGRSMESLLDKTDDTKSLDKTMQSLVDSFKSVGGAISSAGGLLLDFFNAGRGAGDGLFASLGKTFNRWDRFINSAKGKNTVKTFFDHAAEGGRMFMRVMTAIVQGFVFLATVTAPAAMVIGQLLMKLLSIGSAVIKIDQVRIALQSLMVGAVAAFAAFKVGAAIAGIGTLVTKLGAAITALKAFRIAAISTWAASTLGFSIIIGGLVSLATYLYLNKGKTDDLTESIKKLRAEGQGLVDDFADKSTKFASNSLQIAANNKELTGLDPKSIEAKTIRDQNAILTKENKRLTGQLSTGETKVYNKATEAVGKYGKELASTREKIKVLKDQEGDYFDKEAKKLEDTLPRIIAGFNRAKDFAAGQAIALERVKLPSQGGVGKDTSSMLQRKIGSLVRAGGDKIALDISLQPKLNDTQLITEINFAKKLIDIGVPQSKITKILANSKNATDTITALEALLKRATAPKTVHIDATVQGALNNIAAVKNALNSVTSILGVVTPGGNAEGGVHYSTRDPHGTTAGASGYMKQTAMGNARKRPMRSAMGKFNEPTLLVGEENKTEYVIATNPAYRSQNKKYLAAAASELGMSIFDGKDVEGAAKGRHPRDYYSSARWADAFLDSTDISKEVKRAKKRLKTLKNLFAVYNTPGKNPPTAKARKKHEQQKTEAANLRSFLNSGTTTKNRQNAHMIEYQTNRVAELTSAMALAEKRGDSALYNSSKAGKLRYLGMLDAEYKRAEKYATGDRLSKLRNARFGIESDILDTRGSSSETALASAQAEQYKAQLTAAQNNQLINSAFAGTYGGGMGGFGGSSMAGSIGRTGGAPTIVINTLHPGDPNTVRAIADAATSGMGYQGYTNSARMSSGL